ncbi:WSC-domain-containing protein [Paraphaeosphaeria sporulosa]|uniref:WSC-domain-containing protein n=1 Tax=Paraphaeosphaeria sporulosa TaxID=1460663 RepID=A0A177C782_9PLEO|nr:WSC-domain-containing protein [Paraphaeosphaeria sporulosa]OAG03405.1 WSC-domain-containing protein [Paraphaeosphaeria sporulosa]
MAFHLKPISISIPPTYALGATDTITWGGDNSRTSYQNNHNMNPSEVASSGFDQIFRTTLPGNFQGLANEQIFAAPLVYTGNDGIQYIYVATTQNNLYKLDAKTGVIVASRNLHVPFLQVELESCVDIKPLIGITSTGTIDPSTNIWYVTSKTYAERFQNGNFSVSNPPGRLNGRYWQHAVHTEELSEVTGWPIPLDGTVFRNNPNRMFLGGNQHSRTGAIIVGDYLYTGYASHCIQYNYTGAIIGFNKKTGKIVEAFATEGGPEPNIVKGGGIWMSGGGLSYDGRGSMYFATGNGYASQLKASGNAVPGRSPPSSLEEAAVNAKINDDGTLTIIDFFMPYEKVALDGADRDLGTTPLVLLPSTTFNCPNHRRIGVVTGKSGKTYFLNLDDLGGYQQGPNNGDNVIQVYQNENSVYAGAGMIPLGGGYVYVPVTQFKTHVFKFSCDELGNATFSLVSDTPDLNAYILGTGAATVTTMNDQDGTGLLWISDVQGYGLRIYDPIPPANGGPLTSLRNFSIPGVTKFSHPVFGDGRVYISTNQGYLYGFGSPVKSVLNCSSPYNFGAIPINTVTQPATITCTALNRTTVQSISLLDSINFHVENVPALPLNLSTSQNFSFSVASSPANVGTLLKDVTINVQNAFPGYSSTSLVTLRATGRSAAPLLAISPRSISFNVIANQLPSQQPTLLWNLGDSSLSFANFSFSLVSPNGPWIQPNTTSSGQLQVGDFTFSVLPVTMAPGTSAVLTVTYAPHTPGNDTVFLTGFTNGGSASFTASGFAGTQPKAIVEFQTPDGSGWVPFTNSTPFDFGTVYEGQTKNLLFRLTNGGGPRAVPLSVAVSKPPYGIPDIIGKTNNIDLAEGSIISAGDSQTAQIYNGSTVWTLNTNDPDQGKLFIQFSCQAATDQYGYTGCFKEGNPGRQLAIQAYTDTVNNTNTKCISTCSSLGYIFAGTEFSSECWCGIDIPISKGDDANCNYGCSGDVDQTCGGNGLTPSVGQYGFIGCYAEPSGKTVSLNATTSNIMTVEWCATWCGSAYTYFGLEYSQECTCGNALNPKSTLVDPSQCNYPCKGSNSEYCGGLNRMQVYQMSSVVSSTASSVLPTLVTTSTMSSTSTVLVTPSSSSVSTGIITPSTTPSSISSFTSSSTSQVVVVSTTIINPTTSRTTASAISVTITIISSNSTSGSVISPGSTLSSTTGSSPQVVVVPTTILSSTVSIATGSASSTKKSSSLSSTSATTSSSFPSTSVTTSSGLSSPSILPTTSPIPGSPLSAYTYVGCFIDVPQRCLRARSVANSSVSLDFCAAFCAGYTFFGTEYTNECYCGDGILITTDLATDGRCDLPCAANHSQICGGNWGLSIYQLTPSYFGNPSPVKGFASMGCYAEKPNDRALRNVYYSDIMTTELCSARAAANGYSYFGLEYGRECWMDNVLDDAVPVPQAKCATSCTGSTFQNCGGGNFMQLYGNGSVVKMPSGTSSIAATSPMTTSSSTTTSLMSTFVAVATTSSMSSTFSIVLLPSSGLVVSSTGTLTSTDSVPSSGGLSPPSTTSLSSSSTLRFPTTPTTSTSNSSVIFSSRSVPVLPTTAIHVD